DELAERVDETAPKIDAVLEGIAERSPQARVLVVGYPVILPDDGSNCHSTVPIAAGDAPWLRDTEKHLNTMLAERAEAHGAEYVDTYTGSIGPDLCKPADVRWIGPLEGVDAAGVHPNAAGHDRMAQAGLRVAAPAPAGRPWPAERAGPGAGVLSPPRARPALRRRRRTGALRGRTAPRPPAGGPEPRRRDGRGTPSPRPFPS